MYIRQVILQEKSVEAVQINRQFKTEEKYEEKNQLIQMRKKETDIILLNTVAALLIEYN